MMFKKKLFIMMLTIVSLFCALLTESAFAIPVCDEHNVALNAGQQCACDSNGNGVADGDEEIVGDPIMCRLPHNRAEDLVKNILNAAYAFVGLVAVGFIIYGGITYTTSTGDPAKVKKASSTLLYSIIGLVVVLLAVAITNFVLGAVS